MLVEELRVRALVVGRGPAVYRALRVRFRYSGVLVSHSNLVCDARFATNELIACRLRVMNGVQ